MAMHLLEFFGQETGSVLFASHIGTRCVLRFHITCDIFRNVQSSVALFAFFGCSPFSVSACGIMLCPARLFCVVSRLSVISFRSAGKVFWPDCSSVVAQVLSRNSFVLDVSHVL